MNYLILATQTGGILGPFAMVLGKILEFIYDGLAALGVYNIGFCIILFTLVVRMLMLPMTIKQQKFTKLNAVMTPEIQAIQKKYKDKKDQQSQLEQQEEIRAVYDKYGTSPTGSCLPLIIQMPILFALYRVIMNIPAYVQPVKDLYTQVIQGLSAEQMKSFFNIDKAGSAVTGAQLNQCIDAMSGARTTSEVTLTDGTTINTILEVASSDIASKIRALNNFFGLDISMSPSAMLSVGKITLVVALIIPILSGLFQFLSVQLSTKVNSTGDMSDNPMAGSLKTMNFIMPLVSVYMCYILSTGIGLYWVTGSLIAMLQTLVIGLYFRNIDVDVIIEENREKAAQKAEKRKAREGIYREKVLEAAKVNTKNVSSSGGMTAAEKEEKIRRAKEAGAKKGSLASKANMVNEYNKRNEK